LDVRTVGQVCAIYTGTKWALRGNQEVVLLSPYLVATWAVWGKP
jgi:hypothetical protein